MPPAFFHQTFIDHVIDAVEQMNDGPEAESFLSGGLLMFFHFEDIEHFTHILNGGGEFGRENCRVQWFEPGQVYFMQEDTEQGQLSPFAMKACTIEEVAKSDGIRVFVSIAVAEDLHVLADLVEPGAGISEGFEDGAVCEKGFGDGLSFEDFGFVSRKFGEYCCECIVARITAGIVE